MSFSPTAQPDTQHRTRGISEIRATVAAHVRELIGEDDESFTTELIESFQESMAELCDQAEAGYADGDAQRIVSAAHQIKGSAGNVGLRRIAHDWHAVEMAAERQDPDLNRIVKESVATARHLVSMLVGEPSVAPAFGRRRTDRA